MIKSNVAFIALLLVVLAMLIAMVFSLVNAPDEEGYRTIR